uniref:Uncharacterized protein n=1 Tax=Sus scrofa TaxID=9823 RepID=A0A5G2R888_PIG
MESRHKTRMSALVSPIQPSFGSPSQGSQRRRGNARNPSGKGRSRMSLFEDDMILSPENPQDAPRNLLELDHECGKVAGYKMNIQRSTTFLETHNERSTREIRETIPFTIASKRINT